MSGMVKIRDVSTRYDISARTEEIMSQFDFSGNKPEECDEFL